MVEKRVSTTQSARDVLKSTKHMLKLSPQLYKHEKTVRTRTYTYFAEECNPHYNTHIHGQSKLSQTILVILANIILSSFLLIVVSAQQSLCPKACTCDGQENSCNGDLGTAWIPHTFNPSTKRIIINHAETSAVSGADLGYFKELEILNLAFNKISAIDFDHIQSNLKLVSLNISNNNISELKDSAVNKLGASIGFAAPYDGKPEEDLIKNFKKARVNVLDLFISHNYITQLRNFTFIRLHRLLKLDLSYNSIHTIEVDAFFGLNKLRHINLRGNHLIQLPSQSLESLAKSLGSQHNLPHPLLKTLNLGENSFESIGRESFNSLNQLQELYLDSCSVRSLKDGAFRGLSNLDHLFLQNNDLVELAPDTFIGLDNLKHLDLSSNKFTSILEDYFNSLGNLKELKISSTPLTELHIGSFNGLNSLRRLELDYNVNLTKISPGTFYSTPKLEHLSLHMGSIISLGDDFSNHQIDVLDLRGNPLVCDCSLRWLTKWLTRFNETTINVQKLGDRAIGIQSKTSINNDVINLLADKSFTIQLMNLTCNGPPALVGKQIIELPMNGLECLHPSSDVNVNIGFACLFLFMTILTTVCTVNFCRDEKHLLGIFKENLVHNRLSMLYYPQNNLRKNTDEGCKNETNLDCAVYEHVDYSQNTGPVYTIPDNDPSIYHNYSEQQQQTHRF